MYFGGDELYRSVNQGATRAKVTEYYPPTTPYSTHADIRAFQFYASAPGGQSDVIILGTDGGVNRSTDGGIADSWVNLNGSELIVSQIFDIGTSSLRPGFIGAGTQDNGTQMRMSAAGNWEHRSGGDGGQTIADWRDSMLVYTRINSHVGLQDRQTGVNVSIVFSTIPGNQYEPYPFRLDPQDNRRIYAGRKKIFYRVLRSPSRPFTFSKSQVDISQFTALTLGADSTPAPLGNISAFEVAPSNPSVIYLGHDGQDYAPKIVGYILVSADSGKTWAARRCGPSNNYSHPNAIAVDPADANRLWIGLSGVQDSQRVIFSADGGHTWANMSNGLPPIPVNDLVYQRGTQGVLFAATDVGVYRYDPATAAWTCFSGGMPPCLVSSLEIDYCQRKIRAGTFGRGVWESPIPVPEPFLLTQDQTWGAGSVHHMAGDLVVEPGATLTIQGMVNMGLQTSIVVKPHARLIIDGGVLTNTCGGFWKGIDVWGNASLNQFPLAFPANQGRVELKNGARVEHARDAVSLGRDHGSWVEPSGGLLIANEALFVNNRRAVEFLSYPHVQHSVLKGCQFTVNDAYRGAGDFSSHVSLWNCRNIYFEACTFRNDQSDRPFHLHAGNGIYSLDAGFLVRGRCSAVMAPGQPCPEASLARTRFEGFNRGVRATGGNSDYTVSIREADATANVQGVMLDNLEQASVLNSVIWAGGQPHSPGNFHEGISTTFSTGYRLEENLLQEVPSTPWQTIGIHIRESGSASNQVYRNTVAGTDQGVLASGMNRNPLNPYEGLQILCNTFSTTSFDIDVQAIGADPSDGIRMHQGNPNLMLSAGNMFTQAPGQGAESNYRNGSSWSILYLFNGQGSEPEFHTPFKVAPIQAGTANGCPSLILGGFDIALDPSTEQYLTGHYDSAESAFANVLYSYRQFIDGGSTHAVLTQMELNWSQSAWGLRNELIALSPSLSQQVLRDAALQDVLPHAMLLEICLANPEATRSEDFIDFLGNSIPSPMPGYMLDMIVANWDSSTVRGILEGNLSHFAGEMAWTSDLLIGSLRLDTLDRSNEIRSWLRRRNTLEDQYSLVSSFLQQAAYDSADAVLEQIPNLFSLDEGQSATWQDFNDYVTFCKDAYQAGHSLMRLDSSEQASLQAFADRPLSQAVAIARNVLCFGYEVCYDYPEPDQGAAARPVTPAADPWQFLRSAYYRLSAYPNPAREGYATFEWELVELPQGAELLVYDSQGRGVASQALAEPEGQWLWDTRGLAPGLYFYELRDGQGQRLAEGKLTVIHR
jgi:hypothetical protein